MVRIYASELDIFAEVIFALVAEKTLVAGNAWLNRDSVAYKLAP